MMNSRQHTHYTPNNFGNPTKWEKMKSMEKKRKTQLAELENRNCADPLWNRRWTVLARWRRQQRRRMSNFEMDIILSQQITTKNHCYYCCSHEGLKLSDRIQSAPTDILQPSENGMTNRSLLYPSTPQPAFRNADFLLSSREYRLNLSLGRKIWPEQKKSHEKNWKLHAIEDFSLSAAIASFWGNNFLEWNCRFFFHIFTSWNRNGLVSDSRSDKMLNAYFASDAWLESLNSHPRSFSAIWRCGHSFRFNHFIITQNVRKFCFW